MEYQTGPVDGKHVLLTGPVTGSVTTEDGTNVFVHAAELSFDTLEDAQEVAHLIGMKHVEHGHPDDVEIDAEEDSPTHGQFVQRPFLYEPPKRFAKAMHNVTPAGTHSKVQKALLKKKG